ncbi:MAG: hypothetical protein ACP5D7_16655 [Limnospira sp.]
MTSRNFSPWKFAILIDFFFRNIGRSSGIFYQLSSRSIIAMLYPLTALAQVALIAGTFMTSGLGKVSTQIPSELHQNFSPIIETINVQKSCGKDSDYTPHPPDRGDGRR